MPRTLRFWIRFVTAGMLLSAMVFYLRRERMLVQPPSSPAVFRHYLADRSARMVVYSPDADLRDPAQVQRMNSQLAMLRRKFDGLVLYSCDANALAILGAARALNFRAVLLTVWDPTSRREIDTAAELVHNYRDAMALAISIGSEGLMENRYEMADLVSARDRLQRKLKMQTVEVTTSEPWWLYVRDNRDTVALASFGDFVTAHIHVIWDTDIADSAAAAEWTADRGNELRQSIRDRAILIREAGFPGGGNSPRQALSLKFNREQQAIFWATLLRRSNLQPTTPVWVAFEGVDNRAKQWHDFESTWGLIAPDLTPHPAWNSFSLIHTGQTQE